MYINGMKQEMDEDLFDQMAEALHQSSNPQNPPATTSTRWKPDGTYDKKPLDPNFFQSIIKRNYQPLSPVQTADEPSQANPIYQNTVKPTDVWTADDTEKKHSH